MALLSNAKKRPKTRRRKRKESKAEALVRQRGSEALGFGFILLGLLLAAAFATYSRQDPSFFNQTSEPARNVLGALGSYPSDLLHRLLGASYWVLPLLFLVWGGRLMAHRGGERVLQRAIVAPIAIALAAILFSTYVPASDWVSPNGLGGVLGDGILHNLLRVVPLSLGYSLKLLSVVLTLLLLLIGLYVLGVNRFEVKLAMRYFMAGLVVVYLVLRGVVEKLAPSLAASLKKGAGSVGAGLSVAGQKGLGAAQTAAQLAKQKREAARARQSEVQEAKLNKFGDRLDAMRDEISPPEALPEAAPENDEIEILPPEDGGVQAGSPSSARPDTASLLARIAAMRDSSGPDADEVIDNTPQPAAPSTPEIPRIGGVRRAKGLVPDPQLAGSEPPAQPEPRVKYPDARPIPKSKKALAEEQPSLELLPKTEDGYEFPPLSLLESPANVVRQALSNDALDANARLLEIVLDDYGVKGEIVRVRPGPVVTMYELEPAAGLKASRVIGLADDIARSMSALAARVSTIPGRSIIGIELPNENREMVLLREIFAARAFGDSKLELPMALGKDIGGEPVVVNLAKMPHLLIAGTTGSGKSVGINTMILSLLYARSPEECRLIMIDPKMLELSVYDGIPHLLSPVVTDPKKAVVALKWAVAEMEERYRKMSKLNVRGIEAFNGRIEDALRKGEAFTRTVQTGFDDDTGEPIFETEEYALEKMPYIVVIVDEMADLMMVAGKEIEACIQRLAQMARAAGIHLIMATQRPSVDVITGTIKANFPTRISFQVTSKIDSRTILGEMGAEQLLGMGDMLYMAGGGRITRVHGPFVSDEEVEEIVSFLKAQGEPDYVSGVVEGPEAEAEANVDALLGLGGNTSGEDALYDQAVQIVARDRKCSTSYIQRKLSIGYNKAAKLVEQMEENGVVSQANHVGKREVLVPEIQ